MKKTIFQLFVLLLCSFTALGQTTISTAAITAVSSYKSLPEYNLKQFGNISANNIADDGPGFQAACRYILSRGGGTLIVPPGVYRIASNVQIQSSAEENSVPLRIIGSGSNKTGQIPAFGGQYNLGGTVFNLVNPTGPALYFRNNGSVSVESCTFLRTAGTGEMFLIMNTTARIIDNSFLSNVAGADAIYMGGNLSLYGHPTNANGGFQGYGTTIRDNYFNGIGIAVWGRTFTNGVLVDNNIVWALSGSSSMGAPFVFGSTDAGSAEPTGGGKITNNLVEMQGGYQYGFRFEHAIGFTISGNDCYDPNGISAAAIYFGTQASNNKVVTSYHPYPPYGNVVAVIDNSTAQDNWVYEEGKFRALDASKFPVYANDAAADADAGLKSGNAYRVTGSRELFIKP